jgi:hypothetical protein
MPKSWKAESANYPFRRIRHLEFLIVAQSSEQGSERLFSVCLFDPGHFDLVDSMVGPEGKRTLADNLNLNKPPNLILFFVITPLERVAREAVEESENLLAIPGHWPSEGQDFVRNQNLIGPHALFLPMFSQLVHRNPMGRLTVVHPPTQLLTCAGLAHMSQMHNVRNHMVLLRFRQV